MVIEGLFSFKYVHKLCFILQHIRLEFEIKESLTVLANLLSHYFRFSDN